jgi:hypothetical protein
LAIVFGSWPMVRLAIVEKKKARFREGEGMEHSRKAHGEPCASFLFLSSPEIVPKPIA